VKMTNEPPKGLRANLSRSFLPLTDDVLEASSKPQVWKRLQFGLKFFHGIVQQRRKFGPLGWNIRYEFNDSDLETSTVITQNMLEIEGDVPWDTLGFVIGQINYGGRVTDDWDRRLIMAILDRYVNPTILDPDYAFSPSGIYGCPKESESMNVDAWREYVDSLPLGEQPEVFGMHDNANISFQQQESDKIMEVVLSIQPRESGGGGGKGPEEIVSEMAVDQTERVPANLTDEGANPETFAMDEETGLMLSLGTALTQEMARFNKLLSVMRKSLGELLKAIKGTIVMTNELDAMFTSFQNNQVPGVWTKQRIHA